MPRTVNERLSASDTDDITDGPVRQCAVTRDRLEKADMIRFVRSPDGLAVPDVAEKLPGRGAWIRADKDTLAKAVKAGTFSRAFKAQTPLPDDIAAMVEGQLVRQCVGLLGMARKSGKVVVGFDQVRAYLKSRSPGWLIEASDGSEDGRNKVHFLAKAMYDDPRTAGALSSAELGVAFGRERVIHALLQNGALARSFGTAYTRLTGFRPAPEKDWFSGRDR